MKIKENIAISETGFVFNPTTGDSFTLNETGRKVIALINEGKTIEQTAKVLKETFDVDDTTLERYLFDFIYDLRINKLLEE
ncbi:MAG TPA: PqqD family protein [Tenuifilaceae bacterium]|nr:PqqD family protein [Tenuifilaceae bacterium]HOZ14533.1 PqqD family protein [Tenuifilaceae bacterium]HPI45383.1 PqqD family protein [Tenuifilaceae bacterium]HPN22048.1 PqqD family protein [Tenuifilaceae bacterium]HPV56342.1 PqqD family protein [Tenuifilaceae bacterium]